MLQTVLEINNDHDRIYRLTILFGSTSIEQNSTNIELNISNSLKPKLFHQDILLISSVKDFFARLNQEQKKSFIALCKPFEKQHIDVKFILKQLCE